ncbi:hypothetical protein [Halorubrum sp. SY-15]|uniref:hypothetical protein n=1 Tax=Halorubrum sp. SY-15 TaxID=3402277 RepID=UPI003EC05D26
MLLTMGSAGTLAVGAVALVVVAGLVYRDADRIGVDAGSPVLWAGLVAGTTGAGVATALVVPDAPFPGVLVIVALGPLLYVLEREDSVHGGTPADPTQLPSAASSDAVRDDDRGSERHDRDADRERDAEDPGHGGTGDGDTGVCDDVTTRGGTER